MKNPDTRIGIPIYFDSRDPEIDNPLRSSGSTCWYPANTISIKLMPCVESIRDINELLEILNNDSDFSNKRLCKLLITPVYILAIGVKDLFNEIEGNAKEYAQISSDQQKEMKKQFVQFLEQVPLQKDGALRKIRDKLGAHIDKDVFVGDTRDIWELVDLDLLLDWVRLALESLLIILEFDIFAWTRESGDPKIYRFMLIDGNQVDINFEEKLIVGFSVVRSPKYYISNLIQKIAGLYTEIKKSQLTKNV